MTTTTVVRAVAALSVASLPGILTFVYSVSVDEATVIISFAIQRLS